MAGLLIRRTSNSHPDPTKDRRACWKIGDIVAVYEDSQCTANPAPNSPHAIVIIQGVTVQQARRYLTRRLNQFGSIFERSQWYFEPARLPAALRTQLQNVRRVTVTQAQARACLFDKETGLSDG